MRAEVVEKLLCARPGFPLITFGAQLLIKQIYLKQVPSGLLENSRNSFIASEALSAAFISVFVHQ